MSQNQPIVLAKDTITPEDIDALRDWLSTYPTLTKNALTIEFEQKWAQATGTNYAVFVNSGSSANLLMIYALIASKRLKNNKVVVPALSWITDISPIIQFGLDPILVDCNMQDLSVNLAHLEQIFIEHQPACLIFVPILGLVPEMSEVQRVCENHNVVLLIDNCEGQGSLYDGKALETFGLMASCSTYFGHILSTIEGGMITTDDEQMYDLLKMLRSHGWDRDIDQHKREALQKKYNISSFNALYTFYYPAFNVRSTDLQAFIGLRQLERLKQVRVRRFHNYQNYSKHILNDYWKPVQSKIFDLTSNLGYPVIHPLRDNIVAELLENYVEVRPLISGSMGSQPFFIERYGQQSFPNVQLVDKFGFYLPNHPYLTLKEIEFVCDIVNKHTKLYNDNLK